MWAIVAMLICVVVLFWTYMALAAQKHERAEKAQLKKELEDAERKLQNHPDDFTLHAALRRDVVRLRDALKE